MELLDEFNARSWIETVKKIRALEQYPLFEVLAHKVELILSAPSLPKETVEETLNFMDYSTPPNLIYDELIARNITLKLADLEAKLRNYPIPLVSIPSTLSKKYCTWETKGLVILVGQQPDPDSMREENLDLTPLKLPPLKVKRSLNAVKIYMNSESFVRSSGIVRISYGPSIEPCLSDIIRIIGTFTKDTVDQSPPIGWWDKLRIMIHGFNTIKLRGGELRVRVLGSFNPYFDPIKSSGTQGIDICANKGVNIELGGDPAKGKDVVIECGQLRFSLPCYKNESVNGDKNFIRLQGGVRLAVGIRYEINPIKIRSLSKWLRHSEVNLKNPLSPSYVPGADSYVGFRTKAIHITFDVTSPMQFYSGLSIPLNSLNLTLETLNQLSSFTQVYQSVLTNLQFRTGRLFSTIMSHHQKPKLSLLINSIRLVAAAYPVLFSLNARTEDVSGFVGARIRADEMKIDLKLIQRMILKNTSNQSKTKSASKWNLQESEWDFEVLEMCTLSSGFDGDVFDESLLKNNDNLSSWFTDEDLYLARSLSDIKVYPFITSPKLTYYRRNQDPKRAADQQSLKNMGNIHLLFLELYKVQIQLFEERLAQLDFLIWHCMKLQKAISSRMMVFFDDSLKAVLSLDLKLIIRKLKSLVINLHRFMRKRP